MKKTLLIIVTCMFASILLVKNTSAQLDFMFGSKDWSVANILKRPITEAVDILLFFETDHPELKVKNCPQKIFETAKHKAAIAAGSQITEVSGYLKEGEIVFHFQYGDNLTDAEIRCEVAPKTEDKIEDHKAD